MLHSFECAALAVCHYVDGARSPDDRVLGKVRVTGSGEFARDGAHLK